MGIKGKLQCGWVARLVLLVLGFDVIGCLILFRTFDGSNTSFWVDFFRLDNTSSEWLETTLCANATAKVNMNGYVANPGSNCISLHYSHSFEQYYHKAMDCTLQLSFICVKTNLGKFSRCFLFFRIGKGNIC